MHQEKSNRNNEPQCDNHGNKSAKNIGCHAITRFLTK
jgi:hypothetical protein